MNLSMNLVVLLYLVALVLLGYLLYQCARLRAKARELRWKEIQLIQANKMTALGTLVSGVAHEINNPNQVILMNAGVVANAWGDALGILDSYQQDVSEFSLAGLPYKEMRGTLTELIREVGDGSRPLVPPTPRSSRCSASSTATGSARPRRPSVTSRGPRAWAVSRPPADLSRRTGASGKLSHGMARDRTMTDDLLLAALRDRVRALDHRLTELGRHL